MQTSHHHHDTDTAKREWAQAVVLLGLGVYFALLVLTGNSANYINERFLWLVITGAVIFSGLGAWQLFHLLTGRDRHTHGSISWGALSVVAIPLVMALVFPSQPLGADAVTGGVSLNPIGVSSAESFARSPEDRNVLDWLREFERTDNPSELDGLPVDVVAFVYREPDMTETQFMAARFTLSCCVADAFAIGMPVDYADAAALDEGMWVRVRGTLQAGMFGGDRVPVIQPTSVEPTDQPASPYLYS